MSKSAHRLYCLLILLTVPLSIASAQSSTSRINGTITDSSGAVVAGASVTALNEATGVTQTQTTTDAGLYAFPSLPVGAYTVTVERSGFKTAQRTGNVLQVGTPLAVDVVMDVGQVTEVVTVQGGIEQLQTSNATLGNVVERAAIEALPLNGRNPLTLITLEPGVVQRSAGAAGSGIHVNGSRDRAFNVTIDGIEANEASVPNPVSNLYRLNPDNVQEYKVTTNNATAEEGRNSGASVSVATRSGTNDFHGTAFYFLRNDALNANDFYSNAQGIEKSPIKLHQYGFEVGGPIKTNKTFFFGSYGGQNIKFAQPIDQTFGVPSIYTPSALAGVFRYFVVDPRVPFRIGNTPITQNSPLLVDPATGALRPEVRNCTGATDTNCVQSYNILAAGNNPRGLGFDPVTSSILRSYPAPNSYTAGDGLNTATYLWKPPTSIEGPAITARVDHNFNDNNSVFVRYLQSEYNTREGDPLNGRPQVFPGFPPLGEVFRNTKNLAISYRRVFSPRVINEFTTGFARFKFLFTQGEANPDFPNVPGFDFFNLSEPFNNTPRTFRAVTTPQVLDNLSIVAGSHLFRAGFNVRFYRHVDQRGQPGGINVTPQISFSPTVRSPTNFAPFNNLPQTLVATSATNASGRAGISSTDNNNLLGGINNLLGIPARLQQTFIANLNDNAFLPFRIEDQVTLFAQQHKTNQFNFYFQDEWKVRPNLTLNYGARWEINPAATTAGGNVYVPTTPIYAGPATFAKSDKWYERNNVGAIGPHLGLAYSPDFGDGFAKSLFGRSGGSVFRVGYGIAFDPISTFQVTAVAGRVPGLLTTCSSTLGGETTRGCVAAPNVRIAESFPTELAPPSFQPSTFLTPPLQTNTNAPPISAFDPQLKLPTVHQWNLSYQRELPSGFVAQAAYIGRRGTRLFKAYNINQINADPILPSFLIMQGNRSRGCNPDGTGCPAGVTGTTPPLLALGNTSINSAFLNSTNTAGELANNAAGAFAERIENTTLALRLRPNQQFSTITYIDNGGDSNYHAAQFTLRRRFASGLGMNLAYTFAKSIDNQSVDPVGAASGGGLSTTNSRTPTDIRNFREERARSDFDRRHVFTAASVYELPFGRGQRFLGDIHPALNQILGGFQLNGIYTRMSGEPFAVRSGARTSNAAHESRAVILAPVEAQLQEIVNVRGPVLFADNSAFAIPAPGQNGSGRNIFTAPSYWNFDLGIVKRFDINERINLQLRTEMFNAFNHANFDNPRDATVGSPSILSSVFAQACCATVAPPSTQSIIQTGESARVIQFALKLQF